MGRHPTLYFPDGSLTLKVEGTIYNPLSIRGSAKEFVEKAREAGLDGTSNSTAVALPERFTAAGCEKFLEFVFNVRGWTLDVPPLTDLCAVLKTSDFFGAESGVEYAKHYLENHPKLDPPLRFKLGCDYQITNWIRQAFDDLMTVPITELTAEDEALLGWEVYRLLARTQAAVTDHRVTLAVCPPAPTHVAWCYNKEYCAEQS
ncbi:hypothetical protein DFH09DRAFT_1337223 [Mycena vulgaris]|nr:hypothetical protein DFH09DRAFT_1337223 [Mycena vulgaris]